MSDYLAAVARIRGLEASFRTATAIGTGDFSALLAKAMTVTRTRGVVAPVDAEPTSRFGPRTDPITGEHRLHDGVDFPAPEGAPIRAALPGVVSYAGPKGGYGNVVIVDHADGSQTLYAHQSRVGASVGQTVQAGEVIGFVGSTGRSTGPHLHFELRRDGQAVDPAPLLGL